MGPPGLTVQLRVQCARQRFQKGLRRSYRDAEAEQHDCRLGGVLGDPVECCHRVAHRARAVAVEDAERHEPSSLQEKCHGEIELSTILEHKSTRQHVSVEQRVVSYTSTTTNTPWRPRPRVRWQWTRRVSRARRSRWRWRRPPQSPTRMTHVTQSPRLDPKTLGVQP